MVNKEVGENGKIPDNIYVGGVGCAYDLGSDDQTPINTDIKENHRCNSIPQFPNWKGVLPFLNAFATTEITLFCTLFEVKPFGGLFRVCC